MTTILEEQINLQRIEGTDTYTASWHQDWTVGPALHGGGIAAIIQLAATTHLRTDPRRFRNQQHLLNLHIDFLLPCERCESTIAVAPLKIGAAVSTLQLQLLQKEKVRVAAVSTTTNFDQPLGPSVHDAWIGLKPPPQPKPDFDAVLEHKPDENWVPCLLNGELIPMTGRILGLYPRGGFAAPGICDSWHSFLGDERIDETYVAWMSDFIPSMSDTLLRNDGLYDVHVFQQRAEHWAQEHPGVTCQTTNTLAEAVKNSVIFNHTLAIDIEYKRALTKEGLRFVLMRTTANVLSGGRMQIEVAFCNEDMELVATARQSILVLEASRKFDDKRRKPAEIRLRMSKLCKILGVEAASKTVKDSVESFGIDSLIALEVRNWLRTEMRADVAVYEILGDGTVLDTGLAAAKKSELRQGRW